MNYEKKYKEALERAKDLHDNHALGMPFIYKTCEDIFPELKKSEDEKTRKQILNFLKEFENDHYINLDFSSWIAWLEKQSPIEQDTETRDLWVYIREWNDEFGRLPKDEDELAACIDYVMKRQKPADKVEPKFKVGDWVVYEENVYQIHNIGLKKYYECLRTDGTIHIFDFEYIDSKSYLWTIQDAKPGDVLSVTFDEWCKIVIFLSLNDKNVEGYGITLKNGELWFTDCDIPYYSKTWTSCLEPATKEQRDTLFSKIKEAGYEWNAEKKELNKIEKQGEQKSSWSKDDEKMWVQVINEIEAIKSNSSTIFEKNIAQDKIDWLKSIKPNHWKPSKEQIGALNYAYCELFKRGENGEGSNCVHPLMTLIDDLKKL